MNLISWLYTLDKLTAADLVVVNRILEIVKDHITDEEACMYNELCRMAAYLYEQKEATETALEAAKHECSCGGDCNDKQPDIICFRCKKLCLFDNDITTDKWFVASNTSECKELKEHGRLYTKCRDYEPVGVE